MDYDLMRKRLIEARESIGCNRKEFAEKVKIPYRTITNYENGAREAGSDYLSTVATLCDVTTDWLLGVSNIKKSPSATEAALLDEREKELIQKYRCLDSIGQDAVDAVLDVEYRRHEARPQAVPAPAPVRKPCEMTDAELHAELDRQLSEQKQAEENQSVFGPGKSGTVAG